MIEVAAYSTVAMTLGLVVTRPRLGSLPRLSPAVAAAVGVLLMALLGLVGMGSVLHAAADVWRPFVAIASIMVMTAVAMELGVLSWLASRVEAGAGSTRQLFRRVFVLGTMTAATLNNDAAILLLTPLVVALVRRRFPARPQMIVPFAFAVFMAAGVAPFVVSNPMNMVVADFAGIGFNAYAATMLPIAIAGWISAYYVLGWIFRKQLAGELGGEAGEKKAASGAQLAMIGLLLSVLGAYSAIGYFGGEVWIVALSGAVVALTLAWRTRGTGPARLIGHGVSWETLAFLWLVLILAMGLLNVGFVDRLTAGYDGTSPAGIGLISAFGSAVLNNHPMAYMNMLALDAGGHGTQSFLAALIGGDLGPRLLPMGSLAGLLWLESLRRGGVHIKLGTFVRVGVLVTAPALAISLALLALLS